MSFQITHEVENLLFWPPNLAVHSAGRHTRAALVSAKALIHSTHTSVPVLFEGREAAGPVPLNTGCMRFFDQKRRIVLVVAGRVLCNHHGCPTDG